MRQIALGKLISVSTFLLACNATDVELGSRNTEGEGGTHASNASGGGVTGGGANVLMTGGNTGNPEAGGNVSATGGTGGSAAGGNAGVSTGGNSGGGTAGCIDVCALHGAPCCMESGACIEPGNRCVLEVLAATVGSTVYDYAALEAEFATLPQDVLLSIADTDITWAAADPIPAARIQMQLTPQASALHGEALEEARYRHAFRLSCNGQRLFIGMTQFSYSAVAARMPVLHVGRDEEDLVVLGLAAWLPLWEPWTPENPEGRVDAERLDRPELRAAFCERGVLQELDPEARAPDQ